MDFTSVLFVAFYRFSNRPTLSLTLTLALALNPTLALVRTSNQPKRGADTDA